MQEHQSIRWPVNKLERHYRGRIWCSIVRERPIEVTTLRAIKLDSTSTHTLTHEHFTNTEIQKTWMCSLVLEVDKKRRQKKRTNLAVAVTLLWICICRANLDLPCPLLLLPTGIPAGGQRALPFLLILLLLHSSLAWWSTLIQEDCNHERHFTFIAADTSLVLDHRCPPLDDYPVWDFCLTLL